MGWFLGTLGTLLLIGFEYYILFRDDIIDYYEYKKSEKEKKANEDKKE